MARSNPLAHDVATALRTAIAKRGIAAVAERTGVHKDTLTRAAAGLGVFGATARVIALAVGGAR